METMTKITPADIITICEQAAVCLERHADAPLKKTHEVRNNLRLMRDFSRLVEGKAEYDSQEASLAQTFYETLQKSLIKLMMPAGSITEVKEEVNGGSEVFAAFTKRFNSNAEKDYHHIAITLDQVMNYLRVMRTHYGQEYTATEGAGNRLIAFMTKIGTFVMWQDATARKIHYFCEESFYTAASLNGMFKAVGTIESPLPAESRFSRMR